MKLFVDHAPSPVGLLRFVWSDDKLRALEFENYDERMHRLLRSHYGSVELTPERAPAHLRNPVEAYFEGDIKAVDTVPVDTGGTAFQREVWSALRTIPAGTTASYGEIATRIGRPKACRAVGLANGSNPIAIVVPCHRVIGANGKLTGYGGGMSRKEWLLRHEQGGQLLCDFR